VAHSASSGEVWFADLQAGRGHEQTGTRPVVVVSVDTFNHGPAELVVVVPMTTTSRHVPLHVLIEPPEGGVRQRSFIKCEDVRSISTQRLIDYWGTVTPSTLQTIQHRLRLLLGL
jgi:mRNA interferase MazF